MGQRVLGAGGEFSSITQACRTLCDPMNCRTPGLPVHHHLLELVQTHVHRVSDAIQPSYPLSSPSPPAFNLSQNHTTINKKESGINSKLLKPANKTKKISAEHIFHHYTKCKWLDILIKEERPSDCVKTQNPDMSCVAKNI